MSDGAKMNIRMPTYDELDAEVRELRHVVEVAKRVAAEANATVRESNELVMEMRGLLSGTWPAAVFDDLEPARLSLMMDIIRCFPGVPVQGLARVMVLLTEMQRRVEELDQPAGPSPMQWEDVLGAALAEAFG